MNETITKIELLKIIKQAEENEMVELNLSSKNISELPPEIGNLINLKILNLKFCLNIYIL